MELFKLGTSAFPTISRLLTGRKEEVGNGYWVGRPVVSATALKKVSTTDRNLGGRRLQAHA